MPVNERMHEWLLKMDPEREKIIEGLTKQFFGFDEAVLHDVWNPTRKTSYNFTLLTMDLVKKDGVWQIPMG